MPEPGWSALVGDPRQIASVRRVHFADGPERGLEALLMTAGPLALTVLVGRAMDIGPLTWRGLPVGWCGPSGFAAGLSSEAGGGRGFERAFSGFLMTGGLTHIRQPANGEPLHGRLPLTPARLIAAGEDWEAGVIFAEGEVRQVRQNHEALILRRRIEIPLDGSCLRLADRVTNWSAVPVVPQILYHTNFGHPAIGSGTTIASGARELLRLDHFPEADGPARPRFEPAVPGETVTLRSGAFEAALSFSAETLRCLQLWRDLRPGVAVLSIEPASHLPDEPPDPLAPDQSRRYEVTFRFAGTLTDPG